MKLKTIIAGAVIILLYGGLTVCFAQEAPKAAPSVAPEASVTPEAAPAPKPQHRRKHRHRKHHAEKEFTEQQLQAMPPSK